MANLVKTFRKGEERGRGEKRRRKGEGEEEEEEREREKERKRRRRRKRRRGRRFLGCFRETRERVCSTTSIFDFCLILFVVQSS